MYVCVVNSASSCSITLALNHPRKVLSVLRIFTTFPSGLSDLLQARQHGRMHSGTLLVLLTCAAIPIKQSNEVALDVHFY